MCGIAGFVSSTLPHQWGDPARIVRAMTRALAHRGPDDEGYRDGPTAWLGHRRLSIIDLEGGHQPLTSACGTAAVVFNGEIYNFVELREELERLGRPFLTHSDTEVLVQGYLTWGLPALLGRLNGMFAFALWDTRHQTLFLARDRMGKKPLYWSAQGASLLFGSELSAILRHPDVARRIDPQSLREYLLYDAVPAPRSMIEGVQKLPAGAYLEFRYGAVRGPVSYWDLSFGAADPRPMPQLATELWSLVSDAVRLRLRSDVPLGVFLSGGIDSSAVVVAMAEHLPAHHIQTFSIAFKDPSFDESSHARTVARHVGTEHREELVEPDNLLEALPHIVSTLDEPLADASIVPTWLLSQFARRHVTVALGGDGGDELWLGYPTFSAHALARLADRAPAGLARLAHSVAQRLPTSRANISLDYQAKRFALGLQYPPFERHFVWIGAFDPASQARLLTPPLLSGTADSTPFAPVQAHLRAAREAARGAPNELELLSYLYAKIYMGDDILAKVDRASMAHGLEARAPLLDYRVVEFAARVPIHAKLKGVHTKVLLRQMLRGRLPSSILDRPKKGFGVPLARWLAGPLLPWARELTTPARLKRDGYFEPAEVERLWSEHLSGRTDHRKHLWSILVFNLWLDQLQAI